MVLAQFEVGGKYAYLIYLKRGLGLWLVGAAALQINDHASITLEKERSEYPPFASLLPSSS